MKIGSLFAGIGGLELGLERAGLGHVTWQVEIDPFCRSVLARHWPQAERHVDVREASASTLAPVDLICGGFPCQDVSSAGKGAGLAGERSGLWFEYLRIVRELRPRLVVVENVASGARRWVGTVCDGLDALGYRPRPFALSAADVGAPHLRRRVFVVGDTNGKRLEERQDVAGLRQRETAARADFRAWPPRRGDVDGWHEWLADGRPPPAQPRVRRGADGLPRRVDDRRRRLKALGNAVVPQCAEVIGRMIREMEGV